MLVQAEAIANDALNTIALTCFLNVLFGDRETDPWMLCVIGNSQQSEMRRGSPSWVCEDGFKIAGS